MTILLLSCFLVLTSLTPLKVSFLVVLTSIFASMQMYWLLNSVFPSAMMVISFSSGMMILFCYCAMLSSYESKNKKTMALSLLLIVPFCLFLMTNSNQEMSNPTKSKMSLSPTAPFLILAMTVVIISMVGINKLIFSPTKPLVSSY